MRPHSEIERGKYKELSYCGTDFSSVALLLLLLRRNTFVCRRYLGLLLPPLNALDNGLAVDTSIGTREKSLTDFANGMEWLHCDLLFVFLRRLTRPCRVITDNYSQTVAHCKRYVRFFFAADRGAFFFGFVPAFLTTPSRRAATRGGVIARVRLLW